MRSLASLILVLAAAVILGVAMTLMDKLGFYLVLAVPLIGGAVIGAAAALPANRRMSRVPLVMIALFGALLAQGIYWGGQYLNYRETVVNDIITQYPGTERDEVLAVMDEMERETYGTSGFVAFVQMYAEDGMSITRFGGSGAGIILRDTVLYIFWVVEILLMAGMAMVRAAQRKEDDVEEAVPALA